jgi:hypothetical protein
MKYVANVPRRGDGFAALNLVTVGAGRGEWQPGTLLRGWPAIGLWRVTLSSAPTGLAHWPTRSRAARTNGRRREPDRSVSPNTDATMIQ